ncbi:3-hydroxyisobutyryl-CoA hydrolase [Aureimonas ureilytica]|uniref:3-hydroxyisobutyryl-CoA hydrolase n=1 Tax=Aureimonas ureilytica TaxID=401562 RepID=A0A175RAJ8_9HYPH|nr:enoyl-CoA hydratase/isomerase family protein [Aureimonas ureilytica]KTQ97137.1 3-hydroxyisobutyryl-CoA hydrolase [Aureimonas ureilytica]
MTSPFVRAEVDGALGRIHLDRPEALNSLDLGMIRAIAHALDRFERDDSVRAVALTGEGRALCAGGDIKMIWRVGRTQPEEALGFWAEEYQLNARIARSPKPWVAVMDGICMGGGVGLSVHGSHRVVTERTRFAMPETGIGYFPDVGGTFALSRAPHRLGFWLGLTGASVGAADAIAAGLADTMIPSDAIPALLADLAAGRPADAALAAHAADPGSSRLADHAGLIEAVFAGADISAILSALWADGSAFSAETLALLDAKSPTSLVLTLHLLQEALRSPDLETCLDREYAADAAILQGHDFYEGVRAAVVDKDRNPVWRPATLAEVDAPALVASLRPHPSLFPSAGD